MPLDNVSEHSTELENIIDRLIELNNRKQGVSDDIKEVKNEAKAMGFEVPIIMEVIKIRAMDHGEYDEYREMVAMYRNAIGFPIDESVSYEGVDGSESELNSFVERLERLLQENKDIAEDIKEVKTEAKGLGFEPKMVALCVKIKEKGTQDIDERDQMIELYRAAVA